MNFNAKVGKDCQKAKQNGLKNSDLMNFFKGGGVVDCTGECPGDEETLKTMLNMIQNETLAEKYPIMAKFKGV